MNILKSLIIWICFIQKWALSASGIILSGLIFLITWLMYPRLIKNSTRKERWQIGIVWVLLTVIFEFTSGLAGGNSIAELLAAYNPLTGNLWLLVLAATLFSPILTGLCMRKTDDDHFTKVPVK